MRDLSNAAYLPSPHRWTAPRMYPEQISEECRWSIENISQPSLHHCGNYLLPSFDKEALRRHHTGTRCRHSVLFPRCPLLPTNQSSPLESRSANAGHALALSCSGQGPIYPSCRRLGSTSREGNPGVGISQGLFRKKTVVVQECPSMLTDVPSTTFFAVPSRQSETRLMAGMGVASSYAARDPSGRELSMFADVEFGLLGCRPDVVVNHNPLDPSRDWLVRSTSHHWSERRVQYQESVRGVLSTTVQRYR
ncbi:hypothetical protein F5884DRAFT_189653 [Xylogone sp. PMI_703]|nr:hypothetical protein F5884DRAFT_189653 [Xylogone sp. PMI_703]